MKYILELDEERKIEFNPSWENSGGIESLIKYTIQLFNEAFDTNIQPGDCYSTPRNDIIIIRLKNI
jgi:hypothetical protein